VHRYLNRLLDHLQCNSLTETPSLKQWQDLLLRLHDLLEEEDNHRKLLEHSLKVVSDEMQGLYRDQRLLSESRSAILRAQTDILLVVSENGVLREMLAGNEDFLMMEPAAFLGKTIHELFSKEMAELFLQTVRSSIEKDELKVVEYDLDVKVGNRYFEARITPIKMQGNGEKTALVLIREITEWQKTRERLQWAATHDILTSLSNKARFSEALSEAIEQGVKPLAVMFLDLDNMKQVNDIHGHSVGDELLAVIAQRLKNNCKTDDLVARLGGDEFGILLNNVGDRANASKVAEKLLEISAEPVVVNDLSINTSLSIGIIMVDDQNESAETLLDRADKAMYRVKQQGKNGYFIIAE